MIDRLRSRWSGRRIPDPRRRGAFPFTLKALVVTVAVVGLTLIATQRIDELRRTQEVGPEIVSIRLRAGHHPAISDGYDIRYRITVDGRSIERTVFRTWSHDAAESAKVCYEPGRPDNQILALARDRCGD